MRFFEDFCSSARFTHLPLFSKYLLEGHLDAFSKEQLTISKQVKLPLLQLLNHLSEEKLLELTNASMREYLQYLSENRLLEFIKISLQRWIADQLEIIGKFQLVAEDITLINFIRGKAFRKFIPLYTSDLNTSLELVDELDSFLTGSTTAATNTYIMLLKDQLSKHEKDLLEAQRIARVGSFEMDLLTKRTTNSPELYKIFDMAEGTRFEEFIEYVHPEDKKAVIEEMVKSQTTGTYEKEYRYVKAGHTKQIWAKGIYVFNEGKPVKFIGTVQDITERKKVEQELMDKTIALQRSNESLQQFAFAASHDLKEPIRKISTYTDIILSRDTKLSDTALTNLRKVHSSAIRMRQMVDDIMSYSEVLQLQQAEQCNLGTIIRDVMETLEYSIAEKKVSIRFGDLPDVKVVAARFKILFQNLIANAIKFAREGVPPVIEITCDWLKPEDVKGKLMVVASRFLQVSVQDNGIGFKQEYAERIFTLFTRLHGKAEYEGSGIGLAISQRIIENHNGVIFANSDENAGATFTFIIPQ